jgi:hypothetical protein
LESLGVKFIRFNDLDVKNNLSWALLEIKEAIENLKTHPKPPEIKSGQALPRGEQFYIMIKLFRHIRQNLLSKGKTSRYLKYAIGEIILVLSASLDKELSNK